MKRKRREQQREKRGNDPRKALVFSVYLSSHGKSDLHPRSHTRTRRDHLNVVRKSEREKERKERKQTAVLCLPRSLSLSLCSFSCSLAPSAFGTLPLPSRTVIAGLAWSREHRVHKTLVARLAAAQRHGKGGQFPAQRFSSGGFKRFTLLQ